jgi:hypothetical protein
MLSLLQHHLVARATVVRPAVTGPTVSAVASTVIVLSPESLQPLFLGVSVDVGSNDEPDDVEERHPGLLGQESLRKRQGDGRGDPRDLHDRHEAGAHGGADLVERTRSSNNGHAEEVYGVLDGRDLRDRVSQCSARMHTGRKLTRRFETTICRSFDFRLVLPAKVFCRREIITWPRGALMRAP